MVKQNGNLVAFMYNLSCHIWVKDENMTSYLSHIATKSASWYYQKGISLWKQVLFSLRFGASHSEEGIYEA